MPGKWNFLLCFIFLVPLKIIVQKSKAKHKTCSKILKNWDTQVIKWDTQISEELLLISYVFFTLRKETIIALPGKIVIL